MTDSAINSAVVDVDPPIVTSAHVAYLFAVSTATVCRWTLQSLIPTPDARAQHGIALWRFSTIRAWRPDLVPELEGMVRRLPSVMLLPFKQRKARGSKKAVGAA